MKTKLLKLSDWLRSTGACADARAWAAQHKTLTGAWNACANPDWMLWALGKGTVATNDPRYRLIACRMVRETPLDDSRTVWDLLTDPRSRAAIEVAERHARGEATDTELADAARAAKAASDAWDAWGAAWAAALAARDASAAWDAASDAAMIAQCAIIREVFSVTDILPPEEQRPCIHASSTE